MISFDAAKEILFRLEQGSAATERDTAQLRTFLTHQAQELWDVQTQHEEGKKIRVNLITRLDKTLAERDCMERCMKDEVARRMNIAEKLEQLKLHLEERERSREITEAHCRARIKQADEAVVNLKQLLEQQGNSRATAAEVQSMRADCCLYAKQLAECRDKISHSEEIIKQLTARMEKQRTKMQAALDMLSLL